MIKLSNNVEVLLYEKGANCEPLPHRYVRGWSRRKNGTILVLHVMANLDDIEKIAKKTRHAHLEINTGNAIAAVECMVAAIDLCIEMVKRDFGDKK